MTKSSDDDVGEQLTELFVLCAAVYFKLQVWENQCQEPANNQNLTNILHATAEELISLSDDCPSDARDQRTHVAQAIGELSSGVDEVKHLGIERGDACMTKSMEGLERWLRKAMGLV